MGWWRLALPGYCGLGGRPRPRCVYQRATNASCWEVARVAGGRAAACIAPRLIPGIASIAVLRCVWRGLVSGGHLQYIKEIVHVPLKLKYPMYLLSFCFRNNSGAGVTMGSGGAGSTFAKALDTHSNRRDRKKGEAMTGNRVTFTTPPRREKARLSMNYIMAQPYLASLEALAGQWYLRPTEFKNN